VEAADGRGRFGFERVADFDTAGGDAIDSDGDTGAADYDIAAGDARADTVARGCRKVGGLFQAQPAAASGINNRLAERVLGVERR
jgi:hypothetical protein